MYPRSPLWGVASEGEIKMSKRARIALVSLVAAVPLLAGACRINLGSGCELLVAEPGANIGVVCN